MIAGGVTIVVPVRDEAGTVAAALESLTRQTAGPESLEVLVFDGASTDGTAEICRSFAARHPWRRFEVLPNPQKTVPFALNAGLQTSISTWFTRLDGRTRLSANYLQQCTDAALRLGAGVAVGGRFEAEADGLLPTSIAAAVTHPLGVGKGFRTMPGSGDVDHHPFAVWRTEEVRRLGGFAQHLTRNQDDEFSMRADRAGGRIVLAPDATVTYRPRERLTGLAAQYFQYGLWKAAVGRRHGLFPLRSAAPAGLLASAAGALLLALRDRTRLPLQAMLAAYVLGGIVASREREGADPLVTAWSLATAHLSYGAGVIAGAASPGLVETRLGRGRLQ